MDNWSGGLAYRLFQGRDDAFVHLVYRQIYMVVGKA